MGGAEGKVAYIGTKSSFRVAFQWLTMIDTEGTFRPERIAQIAERFGGIFCNVYLAAMLTECS
jgi:hypothetical protein